MKTFISLNIISSYFLNVHIFDRGNKRLTLANLAIVINKMKFQWRIYLYSFSSQ